MMKFLREGLLLLFATGLTVFSASCGKKEEKAPAPAVPVLAARAVQKDVPVEVRAIGNVEAYSTVTVKSLVAGQVIRVHFKEGQDVRKGQLLFSIDPRAIEADLRKAEAALAKDAVDAKNAEVDAKRYEQLVKRGIVAQQQYDQVRTAAESLKEAVKADKAAVEGLKVTLSYTSIYSPIDGRTGNLGTKEGNIVKENDTTMVVINRIRPIYVTFSVPEQFLPEIKKFMAQGRLRVEAAIPGDEGGRAEGVLSFVDNAVDVETGTIKLKGTFENTDRRLWPGQFVDAVLTLTTSPGVTVIPSQAVQTGQQGQYVFVVKPDLTVEMRPVVVQRDFNGEAVVGKGLKPGETVVTDGQLRLVPGAKVEVRAGLGQAVK